MMKTFRKSIFLLTSLVSLFSLHGYSAIQEDITIGFDNVFVPRGFDSNDNAEIIVTGELPSTCYLRPRGKIEVINNRIAVQMIATKISGEETNCIGAIVPYMVSVPLGRLSEGHYDIVVNASASAEISAKISVDRPNTNSINNYTYANVMSVEEVPGTQNILLKGIHPSSCMQFDRVEIFTNEKNDTYSILPIIKARLPICDQRMTPFSYMIEKPRALFEKQLLHIRKIDGTAVNYLMRTTITQ